MYLGFTNVLAKMNGELNFKDVFTRENIDQISFVIPAVIVYFSFIVVAMILLLNLLVGLAVTDTEVSTENVAVQISIFCIYKCKIINFMSICMDMCKIFTEIPTKGTSSPCGVMFGSSLLAGDIYLGRKYSTSFA